MRKVLKISLLLVTLGATGCLKDTASTDLSHVGTVIEMMYPPGAQDNGVGTGLEFFGGEALPFPSTDSTDTVTLYINIAGTNTLSQNLTTTIKIDPSIIEDNYSTDSITYVPFPSYDYTILSTTGTIPAGSRIDTFQIVFYPDRFDPTQNFMLPIDFTVSPSYTISGNFGKIYLHTIGNPLAGNYAVSGTRNNYTGSSGWSGTGPYPPPTSSVDLGAAVGSETASPVNTTEISLGYANLGSSGDDLLFTFIPAGPSVTTAGNSTLVGGVNNFTVHTSTLTLNGGKYTIHSVTTYTNGAGNDRIIDETFVQQ